MMVQARMTQAGSATLCNCIGDYMKIPLNIGLFNRFRRNEDGVALVEFAIFLPAFVLAFFVIVEFSRVFFSYQGAIVGVRDATRYLARVAPAGICQDEELETGSDGSQYNPGGGLVIDGTDGAAVAAATTIILRNMDNETQSQSRIGLPNNVELGDVFTTFECVISAPGDYRQINVPLVRVSATFEVFFPLAKVLSLNGLEERLKITRTVVDTARIFGA